MHHRVPGSFRDPAGFLFWHEGTLYRQVNPQGQQDYDALMSSGLYDELVSSGALIPHEEVDLRLEGLPPAHRVLRPEPVPFLSWPYEWCFGQLKDAALLTLELDRRALERGLSLKDASAYNVQFVDGRPVFIDTLSFEPYQEGQPWVAYRQFCQHFLAPLALMAKVDIRLGKLLRTHIDGVDLDLASTLLPFGTRLSFGLATHLHLHARSQRSHSDNPDTTARQTRVSKHGRIGINESLRAVVEKLDWEPTGTEWGDYYDATNYTEAAAAHKAAAIGAWLDDLRPGTVWDLGANLGAYSRLASQRGAMTIAFDIDPAAVEKCWRQVRSTREARLLPLLQDLSNPSPSIGWAHRERASLTDRGPADLVMALALVHHLAIGNNVPLDRIAEWFARLGRSLVIEFVPKSDSQVRRLLATREDIFPDYTVEGFEQAFGRWFQIAERVPVRESDRLLYRMLRRTMPDEAPVALSSADPAPVAGPIS